MPLPSLKFYSELMGSKWEDIDFLQKVFTLKRQVVKMLVEKVKAKRSAEPTS